MQICTLSSSSTEGQALNTRRRGRTVAALGGLLLAAALPASAHAQAPPTIVSPQVTHTGTGPTGYTVTFRYYDPTATSIRLRGEWFFSGLTDTTTTSSAGRLPSDWKVGD